MQVSREMSTQIMVLCIISKSKMNIAILSYASPKYKSNRMIIKAGEKRNHNVFVINPSNLILYLSDKDGQSRIYTNKNGVLERLPKIDVILPRVSKNVSHCASIIDFLMDKGVYSTQNGSSIRVCGSKWLSLLRANNCGIKIPKTFYCSEFNSDNIDTFIQSINFPIILKLNHGSKGINIMKFSDRSALLTTAQTFAKQGNAFILQEMIQTKGKQHDIRALTIRNKCHASMKRTVQSPLEFRSNLALNGKGENYEISESERLFISKVADAFKGADTLGIDYILNEQNEPCFLEANSNYGTRAIENNPYFFEELFFHIEIAVEDFKKLKKQKDDKKKESNFLLGEIDAVRNELNKKSKVLSEILDNEKMRSLFEKCKGKELKYFSAESKQKEITIRHRKDIIHMMTNMLQIEN
jgi:RimK family alpha-L-glutamate ligase